MHKLAAQFAQYCENNFDFQQQENYSYRALPVCIIDCVYSLRAKYNPVTLSIVNRYARHYMNDDVSYPDDTVSDFLSHIEKAGGPSAFADRILMNHQKLGGKNNIPKEIVCWQLAKYLKCLHIETLEDFRNFEEQELLEAVIRSVKGMGDAGVNYLFMLAGDPDRCKPDMHIKHCVCDACGCSLTDQEYQTLFKDTVALLRGKYPTLTVRSLDGIIWKKYQGDLQY